MWRVCTLTLYIWPYYETLALVHKLSTVLYYFRYNYAILFILILGIAEINIKVTEIYIHEWGWVSLHKYVEIVWWDTLNYIMKCIIFFKIYLFILKNARQYRTFDNIPALLHMFLWYGQRSKYLLLCCWRASTIKLIYFYVDTSNGIWYVNYHNNIGVDIGKTL